MIQFNLLPDVKLEYIKAARTKRLVMSISALSVVIVVSIVGLICVSVLVLQKQHLKNLNADVKKYSEELTGTDDINKVLTIQNQLNSLPGLHEQKPMASKTFTFISMLTPSEIRISSFNVDFAAKTIEINGQAADPKQTDPIKSVNQFVDTLKFTKYKSKSEEEQKQAFSNVVLANLIRGKDKTTYQITLTYDEAIFNISNPVELVVESQTTTRSQTERPIFEEAPKEVE
jgi:hypothetical protein